MTKEQKTLLLLVKKALYPETEVSLPSNLDWAKMVDIASSQGVLGVCFDAFDHLSQEARPDMDNLMEWLGQVEYQSTQYEEHKNAISELTQFYDGQHKKMLLMKGYGLSLNYPVPNHRPTGDIDVFLFGYKEFADQMVEEQLNIKVEREYHKHSHFTFNGITVENHETFIDNENHKSNVRFQKILENQLAKDKLNESPIANCFLPSATWNALFLIRHAGEHFATEKITLRHVLDLGTFFQKYSKEIDWGKVLSIYEEENIKLFYDAISTICVNYLGLSPSLFVGYCENKKLADKVLEDVFSTKEELPKCMTGIDIFGKILKYGFQKSLRWYHNRWKYRIVYKENLLESFWTLAMNRLKN